MGWPKSRHIVCSEKCHDESIDTEKMVIISVVGICEIVFNFSFRFQNWNGVKEAEGRRERVTQGGMLQYETRQPKVKDGRIN